MQTDSSSEHLSREDVLAIADYARIALDGDELNEMTAYMNEAIGLLEPILHYDLKDVAPTFHPIGDLSNVMRSDTVDESCRSLSLEDATSNAVSVKERYFRVPSILGNDEGDR